MFYLIRAKRQSKRIYVTTTTGNTPESRSGLFKKIANVYNFVLILGLAVYLLSDLMNMVYMAAVSN